MDLFSKISRSQNQIDLFYFWCQVAKCTSCGKKDSQKETPTFVKAQVPKPPLPHSFSTPSLIAQVQHQKFALGLPFDRQEKDWYRQGLILSRADMAYRTIRCSEEWFLPIYQRIHEKLLTSCVLLHMDETRIQCNKEPGRRANTDSFMWVLRSGAKEEIEAIPLDHKGKEIPGSKGAEGRESINLLFSVEEKTKDLSFEKKKEKRLEASKPILEAFWSWVEETTTLPTTNERLTKALTYASNQRKGLEMFLTDGRIPISNNLCEANIKPFATAR